MIKDSIGQLVEIGDWVICDRPNQHDCLDVFKVVGHGKKAVTVLMKGRYDTEEKKVTRTAFIKASEVQIQAKNHPEEHPERFLDCDLPD